MNYVSLGLLLIALSWAAPCAHAQAEEGSREPHLPTSLINLDDASLLKRDQVAAHLDIRAFGGGEDLFYAGLGVRYGLGHNWELGLRGASADRKNLSLTDGNLLRHGGNDVELLARYCFLPGAPDGFKPTVTGLLGVSQPSTPDRGSASLNLGLSASVSYKHWVTFTLNPRAVVLDDSALVGIGLGAQIRLTQGVSLVGDYTPIVSGNNTRNTIDGSPMRRDVYGVALRLSASDNRTSLDLGYTNGLGSTTGFSLTPGLDGSGAFYFAITARH